MQLRRTVLILLLLFLATSAALGQAQNPGTTPAPPPSASDATAFVGKEFGSGFTVVPEFAVLTGDFDGDGLEDVAFVAEGRNPMADEAGYNYKVIDPYNAYFGWGNPKLTIGFISSDAGKTKYVLVAHGWRNPTPKAKFVMVNLPFAKLSTGTFRLKKKVVRSIIAEEAGGMTAAVYWDGKNYKWEAYGSN